MGTNSEPADAVIGGRDDDARAHRTPNDGRRIIGTAFDLLDHASALQPARLIDLAGATGIPEPTVHRLLKQVTQGDPARTFSKIFGNLTTEEAGRKDALGLLCVAG